MTSDSRDSRIPAHALSTGSDQCRARSEEGARRHTHDLLISERLVRKRFVTWEDGEADREWACMRLLHEHAPGVAPIPIRREIDRGAPTIVMERIPGEPLGRVPATVAQMSSLTRTLRRVYEVPRAAIEAEGLPERRVGPSEIGEALTAWLEHEHDLRECVDGDAVRFALDRAREYLTRPDAIPTPRLTAMGIADLNPANVIWDGRSCRLVDFEDGGLTEPAFELADHAEHIANRDARIYDSDVLVRELAPSPEDRDRFSRYRVLWATFWLIMLLPCNGAFRRNPRGRTEEQAERVRMLIDDQEQPRASRP